jgi:hypothetical protein
MASTIKSKENGAYTVNADDLIPIVNNAGDTPQAVTPNQIAEGITEIGGVVNVRTDTLQNLLGVTGATAGEIAYPTDAPGTIVTFAAGDVKHIVGNIISTVPFTCDGINNTPTGLTAINGFQNFFDYDPLGLINLAGYWEIPAFLRNGDFDLWGKIDLKLLLPAGPTTYQIANLIANYYTTGPGWQTHTNGFDNVYLNDVPPSQYTKLNSGMFPILDTYERIRFSIGLGWTGGPASVDIQGFGYDSAVFNLYVTGK